MGKDNLTIGYIRECFEYDPATGALTWRRRPRSHFTTDSAWKLCLTRDAGQRAGSFDAYGYLTVKINGKRYKSHRIAWAIIKGIDLAEVPLEIDHENLVKDDNREDNLRPATGSENCSNTAVRADNSSGHKGVDFHKTSGRWRARIMKEGKSVFLGWFDTVEGAVSARLIAQPLHGKYARLSAHDNSLVAEAA
jgi:hypothetical protein